MAEPKQPKKLAALKGGLNIAKRLFADSDEGAMNAIRSAGRTAHEQEAAIRAAKNAQVKEQMANLPARSKKANESLGLYHPVGGGLKLSKPTSGMHATTVADPKFNPPDIGIITPEQLVKEQAALFPLVGDRAAAGRYLTHVDENELEVPVRLTGGPRYMDANYNPINPDDSAAWESGLGRVTALGRQAERAGQGGRPVYGIYTAGSGTNTDFNIMGANALLQQIPFSKITKKSEREFDRAMKEGTNEFPPIPNWPGIRSPEAQDLILDKSNGIVRTKLFGVMGKENFQSMGFPDVPATRKAIVEPELLDAPTNQAGFRMARMDTSGRIIEDPIIPSDYPAAMAGKVAGKLDVPADYKDIFQSHFDARRLLSQPESGDYYSFSRAHPIQYADDAWLNRLMEKRLADERRIKEGEYKEGGEVDQSSLEDRLTKAIEGHMASGGVVDSMESRLTNAISTHMASGGGAFKKLEFMDKGGKVGKLAQGVASVRNRLMADTLPVTPTVKPPSDNVATVRQSNFRYPKTIGNQTVGIDKLSGGVRMSDPNEVKRVKALADQIASPEGYISRIIVDHNDNVIEGQHRLEALRQLGIKDVPVYKIEEMADTMPVDQMKSAVQGVGAIHPDHVGQIINHALESIASEGVEGARQMDLGRFQKHYDAALDAITSDVKKAEGGGAFKKLQFMDKGGKVGKLARGVASVGKRLMADNSLPALEREANLQKFLEPSKTPMRLYHGTMATEGGKRNEAIRRIKPSKEGALGSGVYMTPKPNYASNYALDHMTPEVYASSMGDAFEAGNVLPVHAQIRNPLILGNTGERIDPAAEALMKLGMDKEKAQMMVERLYEDKGNIGKQIQTRAQAQGYDGLMLYHTDGELGEVVSYHPSAVKSAIGNEGTYDIYNPELSKADGGSVFKKIQFMDKGGKAGKLVSGVANIGKRLLADAPVESPAAKQARLNMMPTARIGVEAPGILIPSKMNNVREAVRNMKGNYGARRVERAADEIPNLEKMYQEDALKEAFTGDNASAMITLSPAEFERYAAELTKRSSVGPKMAELAKQGDIDKMTVPTDEYIQYLQRLQGGFSDVPYLNLFKDEVGLPIKPSVIGHEGRHRSRALSESGAPASLVKINPRGDLREGMPRRTQEDFIEALKEELELSNRLVVPESEPYFRRPDVKFPDVYAEGGAAFKKLSFYDKGGVTTSAGSFSPEELGVTADDLRVMDDKTWERIKKNAPATYDWAKQLVKDEASQLKSARGAKDFALRVGAQTLGGIPDLANLALYGVDTLTGTNLSSENPWFGSQQYLEAMDKAGVLGEHEFPISETVAGFLMPAGLIKKGVKKGVQLYKGKKPEAPKKRRGGLAAMSR